jgi:hypothetical protein
MALRIGCAELRFLVAFGMTTMRPPMTAAARSIMAAAAEQAEM